ncbi:MAG: UDP-N-acetylmuramoyl-L-alanine--D-glutamate ligase [Opitutaceae bacterium]|nr:UDP-N-acetylmuramoyl-L-alanine--D-glutamate ligase [Opitutaceae bacterium]
MKPRVPDWLGHLLRRPAAIFGAGVSGRGAAGLIGALGGSSVIYDRASDRPQLREFGASQAAGHGIVVLSPGFPPSHPWVQVARAAGCEILGELDLAALAWPGEIIAITGTNGKTTLTELLTHALRHVGRDARAVGNVGIAFCDAWRTPATRESIAVCEVSSFQAETLRFFEATAALWSNFAEDHLERHLTMEGYFRAKYTLVKRTRGRVVFHGPSVHSAAREFSCELPVDRCVPFEGIAVDARLEPTVFGRAPQRENFLLLRALWRHLGLDEEKLIEAVLSFRLGGHRLARVAEIRGAAFWNDSKGTNFHAVEAALGGFERPVLWIGGGRAKGGDIAAFAGRIAPRLRRAFVIGETRDILAESFRRLAVPVVVCDSLRDAVVQARDAAVAGDHVLLSPGFASFDMFKGYDDRGRQFEAIVADLAREARESRTASKTSPSVPETLSLL